MNRYMLATALVAASAFGMTSSAQAAIFLAGTTDGYSSVKLNSKDGSLTHTGKTDMGAGLLINFDSNGRTDSASGAANIKPSKNQTFTSLTITPNDNTLGFTGINFNVDLNAKKKDSGYQDFSVIVYFFGIDDPVTFSTLTPRDLDGLYPSNGKFSLIAEPGELFSHIVLTTTSKGFKEIKQFDIGGLTTYVPPVTGAVPEPATWVLMIGGFGLVGGAMRRRSTKVQFA